jgi:hypothetical protein
MSLKKTIPQPEHVFASFARSRKVRRLPYCEAHFAVTGRSDNSAISGASRTLLAHGGLPGNRRKDTALPPLRRLSGLMCLTPQP